MDRIVELNLNLKMDEYNLLDRAEGLYSNVNDKMREMKKMKITPMSCRRNMKKKYDSTIKDKNGKCSFITCRNQITNADEICTCLPKEKNMKQHSVHFKPEKKKSLSEIMQMRSAFKPIHDELLLKVLTMKMEKMNTTVAENRMENDQKETIKME